jgi:hypothetical protein
VKTREFQYDGGHTGLSFRCEGCGGFHSIPVTGPKAWGWNGDRDRPVFTPSLLVNHGPHDAPRICHSFVGCNGAQPGEIIFLSDCTHHLAGQVRPLPDWELP